MSLITINKPEATALERHLATLRRLGDRKERAEYLRNVARSEGEPAATALHLAYVDGYTVEQAKLKAVEATMPAGRRA